jgi:hypothetical protein
MLVVAAGLCTSRGRKDIDLGAALNETQRFRGVFDPWYPQGPHKMIPTVGFASHGFPAQVAFRLIRTHLIAANDRHRTRFRRGYLGPIRRSVDGLANLPDWHVVYLPVNRNTIDTRGTARICYRHCSQQTNDQRCAHKI